MDKLVIKLKEPIEYDGKIYKELVIGKFRAKHFKHLPDEIFGLDDEAAKEMSTKESIGIAIGMMPLIAALADVDPKVIDELLMDDLLQIYNEIIPFLGNSISPQNGEN